mgnify:FL=1
MTQNERREWLIKYLLNEPESPAEYKNIELPPQDDEGTQKDLLRSLMNVRPPRPVSDEFLKIQDEYLTERNKEHGITDISTLKNVPADKKLFLWQGDITTLNANAIVNAANSALLGCFAPLHACIDNCIHTFAGVQLRLACNEIMQKQGAPEKTGSAKITPAFNLPSKFVLHTVGPIIRSAVTERDKIQLASCYTSCLNLAAKNGLESVAFCCISTGVFRFPQKLAAQTAVKTVTNWLDENKNASVKKVIFNVFASKNLEIYREILGEKPELAQEKRLG